MTQEQDRDEGKMGHWIEEENLKSQAKQIRARIRETAQKAEADFWEIIKGSFPEIAAADVPADIAESLASACWDAVTAWYVANAELDETMKSAVASKGIAPHDRKIIIGYNEDGWWAANPELAIKHQDIAKVRVIIHRMPSKEELIALLLDLGYKRSNIAEGILRL